MADFKEAFAKTSANEGGYVDDPMDAGGETYNGISRRFNPSWRGWSIIDTYKIGSTNFVSKLENSSQLPILEKYFYKSSYWDRFQGDLIPGQDIANELFDTGVNMGVHRAVSFAQEAMNLLNRSNETEMDLIVDGVFGKATLSKLKIYFRIAKNTSILKIMNVLQGMHYIEYMRKDPGQRRYARGWFNRVKV